MATEDALGGQAGLIQLAHMGGKRAVTSGARSSVIIRAAVASSQASA